MSALASDAVWAFVFGLPSAQPLVIGMLAVLFLIQVYFNAGVAYLLNRLAESNTAWRDPPP